RMCYISRAALRVVCVCCTSGSCLSHRDLFFDNDRWTIHHSLHVCVCVCMYVYIYLYIYKGCTDTTFLQTDTSMSIFICVLADTEYRYRYFLDLVSMKVQLIWRQILFYPLQI